MYKPKWYALMMPFTAHPLEKVSYFPKMPSECSINGTQRETYKYGFSKDELSIVSTVSDKVEFEI